MKNKWIVIFGILLVFVLFGCGDKCPVSCHGGNPTVRCDMPNCAVNKSQASGVTCDC